MGLRKNVEDSMGSAKDKQVNRLRTGEASKAESSMRVEHHRIFWACSQKERGESRKELAKYLVKEGEEDLPSN